MEFSVIDFVLLLIFCELDDILSALSMMLCAFDVISFCAVVAKSLNQFCVTVDFLRKGTAQCSDQALQIFFLRFQLILKIGF